MDIAAYFIRNKTVTLVFAAVLLVGGYLSYSDMSRLEDPEFTIKEALVITPYPGAASDEVEEEVTDLIETSIQDMGELDQVRSRSTRGLSIITVEIKDSYDKHTLPQVWDKLRREVSDAALRLPPGAGPSLVMDDYGDVYGVFLVVTGDGYTYAELKDYVDLLRRELLLVEDVGKVTTLGERREAIYIEFSREQLSQMSLPVSSILGELQSKTTVVDAGRARLGNDYVAIEPSGAVDSVKDVESLLIHGAGGRQLYLKDIATVYRDYVEPQDPVVRYDGRTGIALGISTVSGGNVVTMGEGLRARLQELERDRPVGIELGVVSLQSQAVTTAIDGFVVSLAQAVGIVVVVLLFFMGLRSGLIIGAVLVLTVAGSFVFLDPMNVALERVSLGALIIALGMLVDNAIVIVDGMLVRLAKGRDAKEAASEVVRQSMWPLLGATVVAILAFAAIGLSNDSTGEFCRSLFQVVMVSLLLSWVTAITLTPLLCVMFLRPATGTPEKKGVGVRFYSAYRSMLNGCLNNRAATLGGVGLVFAVGVLGFSLVDQNFFPSSTRAQLMVNIWLPEGTHIDETHQTAIEVESVVAKQPNVTHVTSLIGEGALRFLLTYDPEKPNTAFAQLLVDVDQAGNLDPFIRNLDEELARAFPLIDTATYRFEIGPGGQGKVQARFLGPDPEVLRDLADRAKAVMAADPDARAIRTDWRQQVKTIRPVIAEESANLNGISREMIATAIKHGFGGEQVGVYREGRLLLEIIARAPESQRASVGSLDNLQIWSPISGQMIPLRQVVSGFEIGFEDAIIQRRDRKRSITVFADPIRGYATDLHARVRTDVEAIPLPPGYFLEWGGEYEDTVEAQLGLAASIPVFATLMVLITIALFNSLRVPLIIWLCVPMSVVGVTGSLLVTGQSFGFMSLLGFLSLSGMLIKNAIVLIDELQLELRRGKNLRNAILDAGVSRLRPVSMAALTTVLGMIPLLLDGFFKSMATTIIGGLLVATVLTMIVVPVLYESLFIRDFRAAERLSQETA